MDTPERIDFNQAHEFVDNVLEKAKELAAKYGFKDEGAVLEIAGAIHSRFTDITMMRLHSEKKKDWE